MTSKRKVGRPRSRVRKRTVGIALPPELFATCEALAAKEGLSSAAWFRRAAMRDVERSAVA